MHALVFFHPGNPDLLQLYAVLIGILLCLFAIDLLIDFFKQKPWKKTDVKPEEPLMTGDSHADPEQHSLSRGSIA